MTMIVGDSDRLTPAIIRVGARYGVNVLWYADELPEHVKLPLDVSWGPVGNTGFSFSRQEVYGMGGASVEEVFHEVVHCFLGPVFCKIDEGFCLMPFEWQLALDVAPDCGRDMGYFLEMVEKYQDLTAVGPTGSESQLHFYENARSSSWWKAGQQRAVRLGLLTTDLKPTYKRPKWKGSGVSLNPRNWSPERDQFYR